MPSPAHPKATSEEIAYTAEVPGVFAVTLFDAAFCRRTVARARKADQWEEATILSGAGHSQQDVVVPSARSASVLPVCDLPDLYRAFEEGIRQVIAPLVRQVCGVHLPGYADAQLVRYLPGGQYRTHRDRGPGKENRYFAIVCYLNDDFAGGATRFPEFNYAAQPRSGKAIIFPTDYWHCAEPVTSGCKYVLVAWLVGADPIRWI